MKNLILALIASLAVTSCAVNSKSEKTVQLDPSIKQLTVELTIGQTVKIEAETNPSTGYNWHIKIPSGCVTEFVKEDAKKIYNDGRVGAPVTGVYEFKALAKGECVVEFDYSRAWEGQSNQPKLVKFIVK